MLYIKEILFYEFKDPVSILE